MASTRIQKIIEDAASTSSISNIDVPSAISAMRDSVWVINHELSQDNSEEKKDTISRNVAHLELMMSSTEIMKSSEDLSDITAAIETGKAYLESI